MTKLSNSRALEILTKLLILLVLAKAISLGAWWYLPNDGVEMNVKKSYQPKYQRVDFKLMVDKSIVVAKQGEATGVTSNGTTLSITNIVLKGLYGNEKSGFVIVALKSAPAKTTIVEVGEVYAGYKLKSISIDSVKFTKASKEYILELEKPKSGKSFIQKALASKVVVKENSDEITQKDVTREDINFYAANPKQLWKDISIKEIKKDNKIDGFKVRRIDPKSKMAMLGLEKGDIIIKANNVELKSYKDAIDLYKNINKLDTIQLVVIRNNQEKELVYEIR